MKHQQFLTPFMAYIVAALTSFVVLYLLSNAVRINRVTALNNARVQVSNELGNLRSRLENNVYLNANLVQGLAASIATEPSMGQDRFAALAEHIFRGRNQLRNIGGAPDLVIRLMYPLAGNEGAIGLDYNQTKEQRTAALQARDTGEIVIAGPVKLAQGGTGFIARVPVFTSETASHAGKFWGLISTVIDVEKLYAASGVMDAEYTLEIAMRGKDGRGEKGDFFYGDPNLAARDPVTTMAAVPSGQWQLLASPKGGWPTRSPGENLLIFTYLFSGALIVIPLILIGRLLGERERFISELIEAREKADAANHAKSQFLALMSHELRTPMTGIMGMADVLLTTAQSAEQKKMIHMLRRSAVTLLDLLNDLLDLAKIEADQLKIEKIDFNLSALLQDVQQQFGAAMAAKGIVFVVEGAAEKDERFCGDPKRLRQVLYNLVANALKFTERGNVTVRNGHETCESGKIKLTFSVSDSGIGIPAETLPKLFRKFEQGESSTSRRFGGTGLGLAICKQLVEAMGGGLNVVSTPGRGSTFTFDVQVGPAVSNYAKAPDAPASLPDIRLAQQNLKILVAEDNETTQFIVRQMLSQAGHQVTLVANGQEAVDAASAAKFDVLLMDMQMPVLDGDEATRRIRAGSGPSATAPIIAVTADAIVERHKLYLAAGCDAVVTKPIVWAALKSAIETVLRA